MKTPTMTPTDSPSDAHAEAVRALEGEFAELISRMRRVLLEQADRVSPGLLPGAYKVFTTIARRESISQSALSERLGVDKGQLSRTLRELERLDLIKKEPDPDDGRASILSPTAHGLERLAYARAPQEGALVEALEGWRVEDIHVLTRLLHALTSRTLPV